MPLNYKHKLSILRTHYFQLVQGINFCLNEDNNIDNHKRNPYFNDLPEIVFYEDGM